MIKRHDPLFTESEIPGTSPRATEPAAETMPHKTVKELSADQQPRERAMARGIEALENFELLALILRTGTQRLTVTSLCRKLMDENDNSLRRLARRERAQLMEYDGIGPGKALQIEAVMELIRRHNKELPPENRIIRNSSDIDAIMRPCVAHLEYEELWVVLLNHRNEAFLSRRLSIGATNATMFDVKRLMKFALMEMASGIVLCHNHPSGSLTPSPQDMDITRRTREACRLFEIRMLDHIIIAPHGYYSLADNDRL